VATSFEIAQLRLEIKELIDAEPFTNEFLAELIDANGLADSAYSIWKAKRNAVASLVDISEGGSTRKMSQLFDNYDKIVKSYEAALVVDTEGSESYAPRTRKAERI
jgi:hypothetical protein